MRDIKRLLEEDIKLQEKLIRRYKQELRNMPAGYLTVRKRKGGCAYFVNTGILGAKGKERRQRYLKQSEGKKVWQLQMKRLMQEAVKRMERNVEREKKWAALYQPYDFLSKFRFYMKPRRGLWMRRAGRLSCIRILQFCVRMEA